MSTDHVEAGPFLTQLIGETLSLSGLLLAIREGEGKSQSEFARQLGISRSHLCDLEKNRKAVSPERAARFARVLGYSPVQFVQLALQDQVDAAGLDLAVQVAAV